MYHRPELQDEGIELGNFLLINALLNRKDASDADGGGKGGDECMQSRFLEKMVESAQASNSVRSSGSTAVNNVCAGNGIGIRLQFIGREMSSLTGPERLKELKRAEKIMEFIQKLCGNILAFYFLHHVISCFYSSDGQYAPAQDYFRTVQISVRDAVTSSDKSSASAGAASKDIPRTTNILTCMCVFLKILYDSANQLLLINDTADYAMLYVLQVTNQLLNTLNDMIQVRRFDKGRGDRSQLWHGCTRSGSFHYNVIFIA